MVLLVLGCVAAVQAKKKPKLPPGPATIVGELDGGLLVTAGGPALLDKNGTELWRFNSGGTHDAWMLDNGNILFADGTTVREINPETDEVVFCYTAENTNRGGPYACQRLANGNTVVGENSTGRVLEVNKDGKIVFELKVKPYKEGDHFNMRMVRKVESGNYLVCHIGSKMVREYTPEGEIVFEGKSNDRIFSAVRLKNGNTVVGAMSRIVEFDPEGKEVWTLDKRELKGLKIGHMCGVNVLPNGNMVIGLYGARQEENGGSVFEVTRDKEVVWRYYQENGPGSMMSAQKLDASGKAISNLR
jgi:outer membrane protein assembly factor BamB